MLSSQDIWLLPSKIRELFNNLHHNEESIRNNALNQILESPKEYEKFAFYLLVTMQKTGENISWIGHNREELTYPKVTGQWKEVFACPLHRAAYSVSENNIQIHSDLEPFKKILAVIPPQQRLSALEQRSTVPPKGVSLLSVAKENKDFASSLIGLIDAQTLIQTFFLQKQATSWTEEEKKSFLKELKENNQSSYRKAIYYFQKKNYFNLINIDEELKKYDSSEMIQNKTIESELKQLSEIIPYFTQEEIKDYIQWTLIDNKKLSPKEKQSLLLEVLDKFDAVKCFESLLMHSQYSAWGNRNKQTNQLDFLEPKFLIDLHQKHPELLVPVVKNAASPLRTVYIQALAQHKFSGEQLTTEQAGLRLISPLTTTNINQNFKSWEIEYYLDEVLPLATEQTLTPEEHRSLWTLLSHTEKDKLPVKEPEKMKQIKAIIQWRLQQAEPPSYFDKILDQKITIPSGLGLFKKPSTLRNYIEENILKTDSPKKIMKALNIFKAIDETTIPSNEEEVNLKKFEQALSENTGTGYGRVTSFDLYQSIQEKKGPTFKNN